MLISIALELIRPLLDQIYSTYTKLKEAKELCSRLNDRLESVIGELDDILSVGDREEKELPHLQALINEYWGTMTRFTNESNLVKRVLTVSKFAKKIMIYNERLDDIISMIAVRQIVERDTEWRRQYAEDKRAMINQLNTMVHLEEQIHRALYNFASVPVVVESLALVAKRDLGEVSDKEDLMSAQHPLFPALRAIVYVAEAKILHEPLKIPPPWLIAHDEVTIPTEPISASHTLQHSKTFIGNWNGSPVAIKKFCVMSSSPVFDKYLKVWSSLLHPNVSQLYGAGSIDGAPFFVYEYASHYSLDRCRDSYSPKVRWQLLYQAALGLSYLHKKQIVHGNISCSKLLVTGQDVVKLFGFDASYIRDGEKSNSLKPVIRENFSAPECIDSDNCTHSPRFESDVFSFGFTIIEAFAEENLFENLSWLEICTQMQNNLKFKPTEMDIAMWHLVTKMCQHDWKQRPSLAYVIDHLKSFTE